MLTSAKRALLATGAAAAALVLSTSVASATSTAAGPPFDVCSGAAPCATASATLTASTGTTGTSSHPAIIFTDTTTGTQLQCLASTASGTVALGHHTTGAGLASITSSTWSTCTGPLGLALTVNQTSTWSLNANTGGYDGVSKTTGWVSNVSAHVFQTSNPSSCAFDVKGSSSTVNGSADGTYDNNGHTLTMAPVAGSGHALGIWNVTGGCFNLLHSGDVATFKTQATAPALPYVVSAPANLNITA